MRSRHYTDKQVAYALNTIDLYKGNLAKASRGLKMPRQTLAHWAGRIPAHPNAPRRVSPELMTETRKQLRETWKDIAEASADVLAKAVDEMRGKIEAGEKITASDVYRLSLAAGISTDKYQLLSGGATSRNETVWDVLVRARPVGSLEPGVIGGVIGAPSGDLSVDKPHEPLNRTLSGTTEPDIIEGDVSPVADSDTR